MTMPGFNAETSLYRTSVHYGSTQALVQATGVFPELVCRVTDCPCLYNQCRKAGGTVEPGPGPPCFYTCEAKPGCTCQPGQECCNPFTNFCCPAGETCCNPETKFCCPSGHTCCSNTHKDACCPPGLLCCDPANNGCADITTDPSNCGRCGNACDQCQYCVDGPFVNSCVNGKCTELNVSYQPPQPPLGPNNPGTLTVQGKNFASNVDVTLIVCNCEADANDPVPVHTAPDGSFNTTITHCFCPSNGNGFACNGPAVIKTAVVMVTATDEFGNTANGSAAC
jgi:hypothetical protein